MIGLKNWNLKKKKRKEDENSTELQKPNIEVEVYNNSKKFDWGEKKAKKLNWIS